MEKLKALARQILILAPNIRPYLLTADESKQEEVARTGKMADLIRNMQTQLHEVQERNAGLMRDLMDERDKHRIREEIKIQGERNIEESKSRFEQIQQELRRQFQENTQHFRNSMEQHQTTQDGIMSLEEKTSQIQESILEQINEVKDDLEAKQREVIEKLRV